MRVRRVRINDICLFLCRRWLKNNALFAAQDMSAKSAETWEMGNQRCGSEELPVLRNEFEQLIVKTHRNPEVL